LINQNPHLSSFSALDLLFHKLQVLPDVFREVDAQIKTNEIVVRFSRIMIKGKDA